MNGQSYHYSDSGNGTPTPSSTSYPASLSSQSSRDTSPSRLPPNLNHINSEKTISTSTVPNSYSSTNYKSTSSYVNSNLDYNQLDNSTNQASRGYNVPTSVMYNTTNQAQQSPYRQVNSSQQINSNPVPKSPYNSTESNHLSNDKNHLVSQFNSTKPDGNSLQSKIAESPPNYNKTVEPGYPGLPGGGYDQEGYRGDMYAGGGYRQLMSPVGSFPANNGQENYGGQTNHNNYSYPQAGRQYPTPERRPDQPISSGPPRTNALGIIPYTTEPVMSQGSRVMPGPGAESPSGYYSSQQQVLSPTGRPPQQPATMAVGGRPPRGYPPPPYQPYPSNYPQQQAPPATLPPYSPTQSPNSYYPGPDDLANQMSQMSVTQSGYNKLWGRDAVDLLKSRDILPPTRVEPPPVRLSQEYYESANCSPDIFRCTLTKIPETKSLLDKSRLPLGVLIHPFKDLNQLSVIQCTVIVRCRACRTYINPFVYFVDSKHWKCNLCFRVNDLPDEFQYDPLTKTYGDPSRRPEIKSATIEFIASSEYMVRPPQPACYVFVLDVSRLGAEAGYLRAFCDCLLSQLEALPGDSRTAVAFITFDSTVHYYSLADNQAQPHQMVIVDIDDMFVPCPDNLLVNLSECLGLVRDLLRELPNKYRESYDTGSALGPALQAAYKLLAATGGRVTVFQCCLAVTGPGKLSPREDPSQRSGDGVGAPQLNPITDFYKKMALDCSGQQIAVDLFLLNSQYADLASLSGVSRFSGGCIHHFPLFNAKNPKHVDSLQRSLQRYLCRKIGFESVMRLRCTRGLSIHTFHGNFFVRSTDLLSLPNVNPDAGFGMQVSIDENLSDVQTVCFQAALLYTSSKGERRIRVHTLCLPVASNLSDVLHGADQQCIIGLLSKMAVDRCHQSSLGDAREAFVNVVADMLSAFRLTQSGASSSTLLAPSSLALLPLYVLALLKYVAFRVGQSTRLDDRVFAMCQMKSLPLSQLIQAIYPDLYPLHNLTEQPLLNIGEEAVPHPPLLHLSAERIDSQGVYLMDDGVQITIFIGHNVSNSLIISMFGAPSFSSLPLVSNELAEISSQESKLLRAFVSYLQNEKSVPPTLEIIRDDSPQRQGFVEKLIEDKTESGHSYYEFLQRVKVLVK